MTNHTFLFSEAEFGPTECYSYLNSKTDVSGNCGIGDSGYTQCEAEYVFRNLS